MLNANSCGMYPAGFCPAQNSTLTPGISTRFIIFSHTLLNALALLLSMDSVTLLFFVIVRQDESLCVIVNIVYETISPNAPSRLRTYRFDSDGIQSPSGNFRAAGVFRRLLLSGSAPLLSWLRSPVLQISPRSALLSLAPE
jgi:hypothetical protein